MPVRNTSIFDDLPARLDSRVNPYVRRLQDGLKDQSLPALYGPWLRGLRGNWKDHFGARSPEGKRPGKVIVEIGVHMGKTIVEMAGTYPDWAFVGLDITFKRVVSTAKKASDRGLQNVVSVLADARAIHVLFEPEEIDGVLVFFPDPWLRKKNQRHHRLLNEAFLKELRVCMKPGGFFWLKTDASGYFASVACDLKGAGFQDCKNPEGILANEYMTVFEQMFKSKNLPTYSGQWIA